MKAPSDSKQEYLDRIKQLEDQLVSAGQTIKEQKFLILEISGFLTKLTTYLHDPKFFSLHSIKFILTKLYFYFLFKKDDHDSQQAAAYIKEISGLYGEANEK